MKYSDLRIVAYSVATETEHVIYLENVKIIAISGNESVVGMAPRLILERYPGAIHNVQKKEGEKDAD